MCTAPPAASHSPVRIGGRVQPRFAIVITAFPWVCTMEPISGLRWQMSVCIISSDVGRVRPSTSSPLTSTMGMSSGARRSYCIDVGVTASNSGSPGIRMDVAGR